MQNWDDDPPLADLGRVCANCGYFSRREWHTEARQGEPMVVSLGERGTGSLATIRSSFGHRLNTVPWCFKRRIIFTKELAKVGVKQNPDSDASEEWEQVSRVSHVDFHCTGWYPWHEFFSPKEHLEEERMMKIEEMRKQHDLKLAGMNQTSLDALKIIQDEHKTITANANKENTWYQRAFVVLALTALVLAFVPLAYPSGVPWLVDHVPGGARESTATPSPTPVTLGP